MNLRRLNVFEHNHEARDAEKPQESSVNSQVPYMFHKSSVKCSHMQRMKEKWSCDGDDEVDKTQLSQHDAPTIDSLIETS
jgi:hypothetical protein